MSPSVKSEVGRLGPIAAGDRQPVPLSMQRLLLSGTLMAAGARLSVRHEFRCAGERPLEVVYAFALPRDASLRRFEIHGPGFHAHSELRPTAEARRQYEEGLAHGHTAALAQATRDGIVNLTVGNLRPGEEVTVTLEILAGVESRDDGFRFRFPFTIAPNYHPRALESDGQIELPADLFGDVLLPPYRKAGLHEVFFDLAIDCGAAVSEIGSPSHAIRVKGASRVQLAPAAALPDRDLVVDVKHDATAPQVLAGERGFAVLVPSALLASKTATQDPPREVVFVLDRSGSMEGSKMEQASRAVMACVASLDERDRFGIVAFDDRLDTLGKGLMAAGHRERSEARQFLETLRARGGTELGRAVEAAARMPRTGGDLFIVTDGQVSETSTILETARRTRCRLHTLGIGEASQDRFLTLLARETGGLSRFVSPRERVDLEALELFASASLPVATSVTATGRHPRTVIEPKPTATVHRGTPLLIFGSAEAGEVLTIRSAEGAALEVAIPEASGDTPRLLRGARLITDAEANVGEAQSGRGETRWRKYLETLSTEYSLASQAMALVAVVERAGDRPGAPPVTQVVPVANPDWDGPDPEITASFSLLASPAPRYRDLDPGLIGRQVDAQPSFARRVTAMFRKQDSLPASPKSPEPPAPLTLVSRLEPDGGMPGGNDAERVLATLLVLVALRAEGHSDVAGPFRAHIKRMLRFLDSGILNNLDPSRRKTALHVRNSSGPASGTGWSALAAKPSPEGWAALDRL